MENMNNNNIVTISGNVTKEFEFSHQVFGEKFYCTYLSVKRLSETEDIIPITVSERLVNVKDNWAGKELYVEGRISTYNKHCDKKSKLLISVFAQNIEEEPEFIPTYQSNNVSLSGYICKPPVYRETPLGRKISDVCLAVNRNYGKSDYIPCILWGRNAEWVSELEVGTLIKVYGRIQSREYRKRLADGESETRVAYEVSVSKVEEYENEEGED